MKQRSYEQASFSLSAGANADLAGMTLKKSTILPTVFFALVRSLLHAHWILSIIIPVPIH